jgi:hypothetical protein
MPWVVFPDCTTGAVLRQSGAGPHLRIIVFLGTGVSSWVNFPAPDHHGIVVRRVLGYPILLAQNYSQIMR